MRGHEPLIAMRLRRKTPIVVYLDTDESGAADTTDPQGLWTAWYPSSASVWIEPNDPLDRLDLRFVAGLFVTVTGMDPQRVERVGHAAQLAGAKRVMTATLERINAERVEVIRHTDTLGAYAWPN